MHSIDLGETRLPRDMSRQIEFWASYSGGAASVMAEITLLDGGMGQELIRRSGDRPTPLWATGVMMAHPELVSDIHRDFFAAGATVATVNSYPIHRDRLRPMGREAHFETLHDIALTAAEQAREDAAGRSTRRNLRLAGAIGPLEASYRPEVHPEREEAIHLYQEVAGILAPRVDIMLIETAASLLNAETALIGAMKAATALGEEGPPVWLGLTVDDEDGTRLRSGEPLEQVLPILRDGASAVLANCSAPEAMPAALDILARSGIPTGAYANAFMGITKDFLQDGVTVDILSRRRDMGPEIYAGQAMTWLDHGATIVGGCCETGPDHIACLAERLQAAGHKIV